MLNTKDLLVYFLEPKLRDQFKVYKNVYRNSGLVGMAMHLFLSMIICNISTYLDNTAPISEQMAVE